ncbi:MAG TPA: hypothetical protein VGW78_00200 [Candidatus Babeliales bacterium]|nr:hypothetical protein [Candidatus Babeliales bacterium]
MKPYINNKIYTLIMITIVALVCNINQINAYKPVIQTAKRDNNRTICVGCYPENMSFCNQCTIKKLETIKLQKEDIVHNSLLCSIGIGTLAAVHIYYAYHGKEHKALHGITGGFLSLITFHMGKECLESRSDARDHDKKIQELKNIITVK